MSLTEKSTTQTCHHSLIQYRELQLDYSKMDLGRDESYSFNTFSHYLFYSFSISSIDYYKSRDQNCTSVFHYYSFFRKMNTISYIPGQTIPIEENILYQVSGLHVSQSIYLHPRNLLFSIQVSCKWRCILVFYLIKEKWLKKLLFCLRRRKSWI